MAPMLRMACGLLPALVLLAGCHRGAAVPDALAYAQRDHGRYWEGVPLSEPVSEASIRLVSCRLTTAHTADASPLRIAIYRPEDLGEPEIHGWSLAGHHPYQLLATQADIDPWRVGVNTFTWSSAEVVDPLAIPPDRINVLVLEYPNPDPYRVLPAVLGSAGQHTAASAYRFVFQTSKDCRDYDITLSSDRGRVAPTRYQASVDAVGVTVVVPVDLAPGEYTLAVRADFGKLLGRRTSECVFRHDPAQVEELLEALASPSGEVPDQRDW